MTPTLAERARIHAALGEPHRLAIVEAVACSDLTPKQLSGRLEMPTNLLAHHLDVLEEARLIERFTSSGDRRRRYVRLIHQPLAPLAPPARATCSIGSVLFVCTHNSARSPLAAALWHERTGLAAASAGTHPATQVHPGTVAAASRAGLDLGDARPTLLGDTRTSAAERVITVCDRAAEELGAPDDWWHWSTPDPVAAGTSDAFDAAIAELDLRIAALL